MVYYVAMETRNSQSFSPEIANDIHFVLQGLKRKPICLLKPGGMSGKNAKYFVAKTKYMTSI